jgi:hypothetical protein
VRDSREGECREIEQTGGRKHKARNRTGNDHLQQIDRPNRVVIPRHSQGSYHRWWAATSKGSLDWLGDRPLQLAANKRYFVVVGPVQGGWCGWLDSDTGVLLPLRIGDIGRQAEVLGYL